MSMNTVNDNEDANSEANPSTVWSLDTIGVRRFHYVMLFSLGIANASDAIELLSISYLLPEAQFFKDGVLTPMSRHEKEWVSAAAFVGMMLGSLVSGILSDNIGRKPVLVGCLTINAISGFLCGLAPTAWLLIILRTFAGIGIGGLVPSMFTVCAELSPASHRDVFVNIIAWWWPIGSLLVAVLAWFCFNNETKGEDRWRTFAQLAAIPAGLGAILCAIFIPNTPQWLLEKQQYRKAAKILSSVQNSFYGSNDSTLSQVADMFEHMERPVTPAKNHDSGSLRQTLEIILGEKYRAQFATLILAWSTLSYSSYGLSTWLQEIFKHVGLQDPYASAVIVALGTFPGSLLAAWLVTVTTPKTLFIIAMALSAGMAVLFAFGSSMGAFVVVIAACGFNSTTVIGWQMLNCLSTESFPTAVRATAYGSLAFTGRIGSILAQFVNGELEGDPMTLLLVTASVLLLGTAASQKLNVRGNEDRSANNSMDTNISTESDRLTA